MQPSPRRVSARNRRMTGSARTRQTRGQFCFAPSLSSPSQSTNACSRFGFCPCLSFSKSLLFASRQCLSLPNELVSLLTLISSSALVQSNLQHPHRAFTIQNTPYDACIRWSCRSHRRLCPCARRPGPHRPWPWRRLQGRRSMLLHLDCRHHWHLEGDER